MQYILTEAEYKVLLAASSKPDKDLLAKLQSVCTYAANNIPVQFKYMDEKTPWGCILTVKGRDHYCDDCPVQKQCPFPSKNWSK